MKSLPEGKCAFEKCNNNLDTMSKKKFGQIKTMREREWIRLRDCEGEKEKRRKEDSEKRQ